jgi:hypothetical protein
MEKIYFSVKRSDPRKYRGLPYLSRIDGREYLHPGAEELLVSIAESVPGYKDARIIMRDSLPIEDKELKESLEMLVKGHNFTLMLTGSNARESAKKILNNRRDAPTR